MHLVTVSPRKVVSLSLEENSYLLSSWLLKSPIIPEPLSVMQKQSSTNRSTRSVLPVLGSCLVNRHVSAVPATKPQLSRSALNSVCQARPAFLSPYKDLMSFITKPGPGAVTPRGTFINCGISRVACRYADLTSRMHMSRSECAISANMALNVVSLPTGAMDATKSWPKRCLKPRATSLAFRRSIWPLSFDLALNAHVPSR